MTIQFYKANGESMIPYARVVFGLVTLFARFFGIFLTGLGIFYGAAAVYYLIMPGGQDNTIYGTGSSSGDLIATAIMSIIGIAFLFVRPYRPDVEDEQQISGPGCGRSWWTGGEIRRK